MQNAVATSFSLHITQNRKILASSTASSPIRCKFGAFSWYVLMAMKISLQQIYYEWIYCSGSVRPSSTPFSKVLEVVISFAESGRIHVYFFVRLRFLIKLTSVFIFRKCFSTGKIFSSFDICSPVPLACFLVSITRLSFQFYLTGNATKRHFSNTATRSVLNYYSSTSLTAKFTLPQSPPTTQTIFGGLFNVFFLFISCAFLPNKYIVCSF